MTNTRIKKYVLLNVRETDKNVTSEKGESPPPGIEEGLLEKVVLAVGSG